MSAIEFSEEGMRLPVRELKSLQSLFRSASMQDNVRQYGEDAFQDANHVFGEQMNSMLQLAEDNRLREDDQMHLESRHLHSVKLVAGLALYDMAATLRNMSTPLVEAEPRSHHIPNALRSVAVAAEICLQAYVEDEFNNLTRSLG